MAGKTISRQRYEMRRGDLVRFAGNRSRQAPAWSPTAEGLRSQGDWIQVAEAEEMTLIGRLPYRCSYDWLLERSTPTERGRWIVARDDSLAVLTASHDMCVGRTAILPSGDIIVITARHKPRVSRWGGWQTVSGIVNETPRSDVNFYDLWILLGGPDDYEDPGFETFRILNND